MRAAAALSAHPVPSHAIGECVGRVLEVLDVAPSALVLVATHPIAGALEDVERTVAELLQPDVLVVRTSRSVLAGGIEIDAAPAIALWALADVDAHVEPGIVPGAIPLGRESIVLADAHVETVVALGRRPLGGPMIVTSASGNTVHELDGEPALERLLDVGDVALHELTIGDAAILGRDDASLVVASPLETGALVQVHVHTAAAVERDLDAALRGRWADAALLLRGGGRPPVADAALAEEHLGVDAAIAGMTLEDDDQRLTIALVRSRGAQRGHG